MKNAIANIWVGEFGWELFGWQGYLRAIRPQYDKFVSICRPGHQVLYEDFSDEIIQFDPKSTETTMWMSESYIVPLKYLSSYANNGYEIIDPYVEYKKRWLTLKPNSPKQEFIKFANKQDNTSPYRKDYGNVYRNIILFHARATEKLGTGFKNWSAQNWADLCDKIRNYGAFEIGVIGTVNDAFMVRGTHYDFRGLGLKDLTDMMANCKCVVGPSSGPIHLAALCDCPHVVWSGQKRTIARHATEWNPFNTKHVMINSMNDEWDKKIYWQPSVDEVCEAVRYLL